MMHTAIPSSIKELISLDNQAKKDRTAKVQYDQILPYVHSSLTIGRHLDHAVIVALGKSGHGKSKTINTLTGRHLLSVAKPSDGSQTKAIQRIYIQNPDSNTGVQVRLAYDDTPGLCNTEYERRGRINDLLRKYDKHYYPHKPPDDRLTHVAGGNPRGKLYPNAILLVTTWDSIRGKYPPSLRETMENLRESGLIDYEHPNVIVVVTKSLSSWDDYEDFDDDDKKNQWQEDADEKKRIIDDLRLEVFPSSASWQVVFIENGGGKSILQDFKRLPNGELSYQNLFEAIYNLFGANSKKGDLVGLEALRFLTGDHSIVSRLRPSPVETLLWLDDPNSECSKREDSRFYIGSGDRHNFAEVAKSRIGVCYDPIHKAFGRVPVVIMNDSDIEIDLHASRPDCRIIYSDMLEEVESATTSQLGLEFDIPSAVGARFDYSSSSGATAGQSSNQHMFKDTKRTAVAKLRILTPTLSDEMCRAIKALPHWDDGSSKVKEQYRRFFSNHGTHVNVQAAIGGTLCVVVQGGSEAETDKFLKTLQTSAAAPVAPQFVTARAAAGPRRSRSEDRSSAQASISIKRIGGKIVDTQLSTILHELFAFCRSRPSQPSPVTGWVDVRSRWIEALKTDSAFCPRDPETRYVWLSDLEGLNSKQKRDLRTASEWYLRGGDTPSARGQENSARLDATLRENTNWFRRIWNRIQVWSKNRHIFERIKRKAAPSRSSICRTFGRVPVTTTNESDMEIIRPIRLSDTQISSMANSGIRLPNIRNCSDGRDAEGEEYRRWSKNRHSFEPIKSKAAPSLSSTRRTANSGILLNIRNCSDGREADIVRPYVNFSANIGRHPNRFVVLLLGETGHGKTKTINQLVGKNHLKVAQRCAGSTTKVVERVNMPITVDSNGDVIGLTVSFDDTPGFGSTIFDDKERMEALLDRYAENHFPKLDESRQIYPNVILIVTSWDSVKEDDSYFTSFDKTIQYLNRSRLVGNKRGNVIVVVTKSLSFWNDYEDASSQKEREICWREDAEKKKSIINGFRSKAFAGSDSEWPIVFVENGGGMSANPRRLPNEESYPQNLFNAILVSVAGSGDLVGKVALQDLTRALDHPESRAGTLSSEVLETSPSL